MEHFLSFGIAFIGTAIALPIAMLLLETVLQQLGVKEQLDVLTGLMQFFLLVASIINLFYSFGAEQYVAVSLGTCLGVAIASAARLVSYAEHFVRPGEPEEEDPAFDHSVGWLDEFDVDEETL